MSSKFTAVSTPDAPSAIGPYSQAIKSNLGLLFCSGQVPFDPKTMEFVPGGAAEQTEQVFTNIEAVLKAENLTLNDVIKATVFIKDMGDFGTINTVYAKRFGDHKPARSCVEVARLPKDALVEIEVIAQWK